MLIRIPGIFLACLCVAGSVNAQPAAQSNSDLQRVDLQSVMERLDRLEKQNDRLEKQNEELTAAIRQLSAQLGSTQASLPATSGESANASQTTDAPQTADASQPPITPPTLAERADVQESRTDELAQSKVGTTQRMPVSLTGMVLFNAFRNSGYGGGGQYPETVPLSGSPSSTGATFRQTIIGLTFNGPDLPGGGKASGSAYFDFWGGTASPSNNLFRIRQATIDLTWKNTTITAGQDKPIVAPRDPTSLAQVAVAPLAGAGNLWEWQPQMRIEQRFVFGQHTASSGEESSETGMRIQAGVYETTESYPSTAPAAISTTLEPQRPGYEGRVLFYHGSAKRRFEIAPGFHFSDTHVAGQSVASQLGTLDWLVRPSSFIEFTGAMFHGTNASAVSGLRQGFTIVASGPDAGDVIPVHATGGWGQLAVFPASRLSLHFYGGEESDRPSDLPVNSVGRNLIYAGNAIYKLSSNVLASFEVSQTRTDYVSAGVRLSNHYDLALAYLF
jgi:hypothetical protein